MHRVTVVIPVYNRQTLAERALRSVLAQNVPDMEVIIVDDCSIPPFVLPADIAANPNIQLIRHDSNLGAGGARNTAAKVAAAEWLAFLDSDDYWLPGTLQPRLDVAIQQFDKNCDPLVAYAAGFILDNKRTGLRVARIPRESADPIDFASGCWFSPGSTALLRKELYDRVGPNDITLRRLEDLDWFLRFASLGGHLKVANDIVAVIETGPKVSISAFEQTARHLHEKYFVEGTLNQLPPRTIRRLKAYLNLERASIFAAERRWLKFSICMACSMI